jgi:hypothetical protein
MKQNLKRVLAIMLSALVIALAFTGCGSASGNTEAVAMNGQTIGMDELKMYVYTLQDKIETTYAMMIYYYGQTYDDFWKSDSGYGSTMWEENTTLSIEQLVQTKVLVKFANENGITLTDDENARVQENISTYRTKHARAAQYASVTDTTIEKYYKENALANKAAMALQEGVSTEFDAETFRRKRVTGVTVSPKSTVPSTTEAATAAPPETTTGEHDKAETTTAQAETYSDDDRNSAREAALKDIEERMKKGEKIEDIVKAYENDRHVTVSAISAFSCAPSDAVEEGKDKTSYKNYAWEMSTGEVLSCEIKASGTTVATGYVLHCENDDDAEYRKSAEDTELENRKNKQFQEKYEELAKKISGFHVYTEAIAAAVSYKGQTTEETTAAPTEAPTTTAEETTAAN